MAATSNSVTTIKDEEALEHLARVPIFQTLGPDDLNALAAITRIVRYAPGEQIFGAGEASNALHVVIDGTVRLMQTATDGPMRLAATREPGQCYGEIGFLTGQPLHLAALNGPAPGRHVVLDRKAFEALALRHPALAHAVMTALIDTLIRRMDNVPPYVRDYLVWGHRPRLAAPPATHAGWGYQLFLAVGAAWGVVATLLWLGLESVFMPHVVRTITSMGLTMIALTIAGALAGLALGAILSLTPARSDPS